MYTDNEIFMANAALQVLKDGGRNRREVLHAMGGLKAEHYAMLRTLTEDLKLISKGGDTLSLTFEGRKAAGMGFKAYVEERERKEREPQKVKFVEERFLGLSRSVWYQVIGWSIGLLGALACFL